VLRRWGRGRAAVEAFEVLARRLARLGQSDSREMPERNARVSPADANATLPGPAANTDPQAEAGNDRVPLFAGRQRGEGDRRELLCGHVFLIHNALRCSSAPKKLEPVNANQRVPRSGFGCNLGAKASLYPRTPSNTME
jgi:hypothetical protein